MVSAPVFGITGDRMEAEPSVLDSLRRAVEAAPDDVPLRVHLAGMFMDAGLRDEAVRQVGAILQRDPGNGAALALLQQPAHPPAQPPPAATGPAGMGGGEYDWSRAESEVQDLLPPMFVGGDSGGGGAGPSGDDPGGQAFDVEQAGLRLADVAGMAEVKQRNPPLGSCSK
jgi:hypothetical protein